MDGRTGKGNERRKGGPGGEHVTRVPLRRILIVLFATQVLLAVGLVGYFSFRNARGAVNEVAHQLRDEVTTRIEEQLREFLATPHIMNEVNADLIAQGVLDAGDAEALALHFWQQVQAAPSVSSLYFGNTKGGVTDAGREGRGGALYVIQTDGFAAGTFRKFSADSGGNRARELQAVPNFDARTRGWYSSAAAKGGPTWSDVYLLFSGQDMAISASRPVLNPRGELIGVVGADLFLSQVSDFLRTLKIGTNGQSFIMERNGLLVASSADTSPIAPAGGDGTPRRLSADGSSSPMVRAAAAAAALAGSESDPQTEFTLDGERHFLQVSPIQDSYGIDWLVAVAVPERDFMATVTASTRVTFVLIFAAAVIAVAFGIIASRWVTRPMRRLGLSAQALARGEWREVSDASRIAEVASLSQSFNSMTRQLEQTVNSLETQIAERVRVEGKLRESEGRYRLLASNAADVIWTMDMDGWFTYVSPSVQKLRGYTAEEVMREPFTAALTPGSAAVVKGELAAIRERVARGQAVEEHYELEQPCKDGTTVWTETAVSSLVDAKGKLLGIVGVSRNITSRKRAEQAQLKLEIQLRHSQKLESIGTLASGIAHEVNNPLTGIINYAELIERRVEDPQLQEFARGIIGEGNRVAEIVRGLLSFARQESTEQRPARMPDILHTTLALIGATMRRDQILVQEEVAEDLPAVRCNPQQIQQILINLLTNARDALNRKFPGRNDEKLVRIRIAPLERDGKLWVRTTVEDCGTGVPETLRSRIFDPFFTTKPRDMGTGLGLSISYGIAKEHGGELSVESEEGRFARFHLDLPAEST